MQCFVGVGPSFFYLCDFGSLNSSSAFSVAARARLSPLSPLVDTLATLGTRVLLTAASVRFTAWSSRFAVTHGVEPGATPTTLATLRLTLAVRCARLVAPQKTERAAIIVDVARLIGWTRLVHVILPDLGVVQAVGVRQPVERQHRHVGAAPLRDVIADRVRPVPRRHAVLHLLAEHVDEAVVAEEKRFVRRARQISHRPVYPEVCPAVEYRELADHVRQRKVVV